MRKLRKALTLLITGVTLITILGIFNVQQADAVVFWSRSNLNWVGNQYQAIADAEFTFRGEVRAHATNDRGLITRSSAWRFGSSTDGIIRASTTFRTETVRMVGHAHEVR